MWLISRAKGLIAWFREPLGEVVVVVVVALLSPRNPTRREESAGPVIPLL